MNVLLIGGSGQLGREIRARWSADRIVAPPHRELDLEDAVALADALERERPDVLINCAAYHNVDLCETTPERAFAVNALAVERAARLVRERGAVFVTISTDYVFDGILGRPYEERDAPHPLNAYGASKLAGELLVERLCMRAFVVRTCGVYGRRPSAAKGHTFVDRVLAQARTGEPMRVVNDATVSPTFAGDLALAIRALLDTDRYGLYHAVNAGAVTWYAFAREALAQAGIAGNLTPIARSDWKAPAVRPAYSALASRALGELGIGLPDWRAGLGGYLAVRERDAE